MELFIKMMKLLVISLLFSLASTEEGMSDLSTTTETAASDNVDGKVTCIAPSTSVEEGKNTSITCHFPFDVSHNKFTSVDVHLQPKNGNLEKIALCMRLNTETLDCTTEKGYSIEGEVKTSLKLNIINISTKHNGLVFCQVMPQYGDMPDVERCSLSVLGKVTCIPPSTPVEEGKDISITCHFPFDVSQEDVYVYLEPKGGKLEKIAWCERPNTETLDCTTEKGYSIEGEVKTSLKLHIMNISAKHNGLVFCDVMPDYRDMPEVEKCSLSVHGMSDLPTTTETTASVNVDGKVTCIAPSAPVEEGKDISITCHFPFDVSQENSISVDVYRQPNNGDQEAVVSCLRQKTETLDCTTKKGYSIEGEVKTSLKLYIMNISAKHNGLVFCQVMPQYGEMPDIEICSLSVLGKVTCIAPSAPVEEGKDISITCHFPFDVSQENCMSVDVYLEPKGGKLEAVAWCKRLNTETLDCTVKKGYSIEGEVKTSLKLHIINISPKHNGLVFCQVMPQYGDMPDVEICSLSVQRMSDVSTTTETTTFANVDDCAGDDESNVGLYFGIGVVVGVGSTLVLGIITSVCCSWYTNRKRKKKRDVENSCFNIDQICARNRRPQEENSRETEQMLPKHRKGNVNAHVPYSDRAELKNHMMYPMENVRQNGGMVRTSPLPKEYAKQASEPMLCRRRKGNFSVDDGEVEERIHLKGNGQHHVPYSDLAELNNLNTSMKNVQQASKPMLRRCRKRNFSVDDAEMIPREMLP